ncbi:MAG: NAD(P)-dependent oxidoreductase [Chthoniobacteraceae bacterium]
MTIYFVDIEPSDEAFYGECLAEQDLISVRRLAEVDSDAEIVCVFIDEKIDDPFLAAHPKLRLVATRSTSVDHIDLPACERRGVRVCHVANYGEGTVAEHTFALMLALARRLREIMDLPKAGRFSYEATRGLELHGKTLGLVGMGRIGRRVAVLANAFQMRVIASDIDTPSDLAARLHFEWASFDELLARADIISLHAALTPQTYHLIDAASLARMKPGVLIVNTARGALIDTNALRAALESGHVGGAGLDVLQDERVLRQNADDLIAQDIVRHLRSDARASEAHDANRIRELEELMLGDAILSRANVVFTPHVAFNTHEAARRMAETTAENIRAFLAGRPQNLVMPQ